MVKKSKGFRAATRHKLRQKGRPTITKFLQKFDIGQNVIIMLEPSSHKGMPHPRYKGNMGKVIAKRGKCYVVEIKDGNSLKKFISKPEHLKPI